MQRPSLSSSTSPVGQWLRIGLISLVLAGCTAALANPVVSADPTAETSNLKQWIGVDIISLISSADIIGKVSLVLLAAFSVVIWTVIVYKFLHIRQATIQTDQFVEICNQGNGDLEEAFRASSNFPDSPLAQILREGYLELEVEDWYRGDYMLAAEARIELAKVSLERIFERTITHELAHLESKLAILATATTVCPFIGLFGTVWGIMVSFQALSGSSAAIASLAPGIATALLCTVGGLTCAIPANVTYNYLTHNVRKLTGRMDAFALELSNIIQKQVIKQNSNTLSVR
ncbi:MAG: MotA/TolQ/ExbB proton channel family protein [Candidatus Sumerlaeia bacterium]